MKRRDAVRPLLPPARLEVVKPLPHRRQWCDGEHGSCLRCCLALSSAAGEVWGPWRALPAPAAGGGPVVCRTWLYCPILTAALATLTCLTQKGSTSDSDKEAVHMDRKFCTPAEVLGWVQQRLTVPHLPKRGGCWGPVACPGVQRPSRSPPCPGKASAEVPLPAEDLPRYLLSHCNAGEPPKSGVQGPPG